MYPELFHLGSFTFYSYGLFASLALLAAGCVVYRLLELRGLESDLAGNMVIVAAVGGFAGARTYWLAEHWDVVSHSLWTHVISGAGFTWYGGFIGGFVAVTAWSVYRKIPVGVVADIMAPAVALGYAIGRVACQFAGDGTYGKASHLPWAMSYPRGTVPTSIRVHPTLVYETLAMLLVFWILYRLARTARPGWYVFAWFLVLSGVERFGIEFLRLNPRGPLGLTAPQWFAIASVGVGTALVVASSRRTVPATAASSTSLAQRGTLLRDLGGSWPALNEKPPKKG